MKSSQLGFVLAAVIAIGLAGLIIRIASSGSDELVLSGLVPLDQAVNDMVTIEADESEAELVRVGETWRVGSNAVFQPKLDQFWAAVSDISGAQLVAANPDNHERMGVAEGQGTVVSFFLGPALQEQFITSNRASDVGLCYVRRAGRDEVYGIPCLSPDVFDPDPDDWRNPVVMAIPVNEVESVSFTYPNEQFDLKVSGRGWVVAEEGDEERAADVFLVDSVLTSLEVLVASGFATDEEAKDLRFNLPDALVRVRTRERALTPPVSLRFLERDDGSYYLRTGAQPTVFIVDRSFADGLLIRKADFVAAGGG